MGRPFVALHGYEGDTHDDCLCVAHGDLYAMMLPLVLGNVDNDLISRHGFDHTACIVSERWPESLICTTWNDVMIASVG